MTTLFAVVLLLVAAFGVQVCARIAAAWPCDTWWDYVRPRWRRKDGSVS